MALGLAALRGGDFLNEDLRRLQEEYGHSTTNWSIERDYHFGGYAKRTPELDRFIDDFRSRHGIALDPLYWAKMMFGLLDLAEQGRFPPGTVIVAVPA